MENDSLNRELLLDLTRINLNGLSTCSWSFSPPQTQALKAEIQVFKEENRLLKEKIKVLETRLDKAVTTATSLPPATGTGSPCAPPQERSPRTAGTFRRQLCKEREGSCRDGAALAWRTAEPATLQKDIFPERGN
ncbi:MAG: hypothetical protein ACYCTV_04910 [Leptospirales bacterium]